MTLHLSQPKRRCSSLGRSLAWEPALDPLPPPRTVNNLDGCTMLKRVRCLYGHSELRIQIAAIYESFLERFSPNLM